MRSLKLWTVVGSVALILGTSGVASGASETSSPKAPKVVITAPPRVNHLYFNQAEYAAIKATNFPPDTAVSFMECAVPTQADPNRCSESSWAQAEGTTNAKGKITFSKKNGSLISLLGGFFFSDADSDYCGDGSGGSSACYVTVQDTSPGQTDISASTEYWSFCTHLQGYRCYPKAPHN